MFSALVKKEFLLVSRDKHALMALFVMPAIFILIMSVAMRDMFSQKNVYFDVFIVDNDKTAISKILLEEIRKNKLFHVVAKNNAQYVITLPKEYTKNSTKKLKIDIMDSLKSDNIELFKAKLLKAVVNLKLNILKSRLAEFSDEAAATLGSVSLETNKLFDIKYNKKDEVPNSTQQSVPTWIVFGMFFIIIPMSTIYINERKQNTLSRLVSMNVSVTSIVVSKTIPYMLIAQIQMWVMVCVGIFVVPFFNTPALEINGTVSALIFLSFCLSVSAIGVSSLIAVSASSSEQATTIGGILNILFGAIGGVMVPKFIMPESMQKLASISPMSWGLDGFLDIFLKGGDIFMVANESFMLLIFGFFALIVSMIILQKKIQKGL